MTATAGVRVGENSRRIRREEKTPTNRSSHLRQDKIRRSPFTCERLSLHSSTTYLAVLNSSPLDLINVPSIPYRPVCIWITTLGFFVDCIRVNVFYKMNCHPVAFRVVCMHGLLSVGIKACPVYLYIDEPIAILNS